MFVLIWNRILSLLGLLSFFSTRAEVCSRSAECYERSDDCAAEASGRDRVRCARTGVDDAVVSLKKGNVELGRSFQMAVSVHDWALAESLIPLADPQRLNDGLCIAVDSIWFLRWASHSAHRDAWHDQILLKSLVCDSSRNVKLYLNWIESYLALLWNSVLRSPYFVS